MTASPSQQLSEGVWLDGVDADALRRFRTFAKKYVFSHLLEHGWPSCKEYAGEFAAAVLHNICEILTPKHEAFYG